MSRKKSRPGWRLAALCLAAFAVTACTPAVEGYPTGASDTPPAEQPASPAATPGLSAPGASSLPSASSAPITEPGGAASPGSSAAAGAPEAPAVSPAPEKPKTPASSGLPGAPADLAVPSRCGRLQVAGNRLADQSGNLVQLRGISTHGLAWFPQYVNEACFRQLREEWGVNVLRLALYTEEYGGYCAGGDQEQLRALVDQGIAYAAAQDMYLIIDWHILSDGDPNRHGEEAAAFFDALSAQYAGCDHLLYEICNEPNGSAGWAQVKEYAQRILTVIRANDPQAVVLVGTPNWCQRLEDAAADPLEGFENVMYTLHFYAATHTESLRHTLAQAVEGGLPVFVSEYGICDASGGGAINEKEADRWVALMDELGVSYVAWNLSNKGESAAILRSGCSKTSGFTLEDLSDSGRWLYRTLTGGLPAPAAPEQSTSGAPAGSGPTQGVPTAPAGTPAPAEAGAVTYTARLQTSWENNGQTFLLYQLVVQNSSEAPVARWQLALPFSEAVTLENGWGGSYRAEGSTLYIAAAEYNSALPSGGSAENVGFIVKGGPGLRLEG